MKISEATNAFKICDVSINNKDPMKLDFNYLNPLYNEKNEELSQEILKENITRVYLIVVDDEIKKIGGSQDKGGIKNTLDIYRTGGKNGRPSIRSFGIWFFLYDAIQKNKKIEFYMIYQENITAQIKGLYKNHTVTSASISFKVLEECCKKDYRERENGKFPEWNIQEQGGDWPKIIKEEHVRLMEISTTKKTKPGRKEINPLITTDFIQKTK